MALLDNCDMIKPMRVRMNCFHFINFTPIHALKSSSRLQVISRLDGGPLDKLKGFIEDWQNDGILFQAITLAFRHEAQPIFLPVPPYAPEFAPYHGAPPFTYQILFRWNRFEVFMVEGERLENPKVACGWKF